MVDVLVPTVLTAIAILISFRDIAFIQEKVHNELPDQILVGSSDHRERVLLAGEEITKLRSLSTLQKEQIRSLCMELRASTGLTRDGREQIVQMCAGAALLIAFAANIVVAIATAVFYYSSCARLSVSDNNDHSYRGSRRWLPNVAHCRPFSAISD